MEYACTVCGAIGPTVRCAAHRGRAGSTRAWRAKRLQILRRDRYVCQQCGRPATEVDHIVPVVRGGTDDDTNLRALCRACNRHKGTHVDANA